MYHPLPQKEAHAEKHLKQAIGHQAQHINIGIFHKVFQQSTTLC